MSAPADPWSVPETIPPLGEFLAYAWVNRRLATTTFAAVLLPLLLLSAILPAHYEATATLAVLPAPEFTVRQDAGSRAQNASALAMDQIMKAEAEILASDDLHDAAIGTLGLATLDSDLAEPRHGLRPLHALRWLASPWLGASDDSDAGRRARALERFGQQLTVHATKDGNVIELHFTHRDPTVAARALDALLAAYAQRRARIYDDPQARTVRGERDSIARDAVAADQRLAGFKATHRIANFEQERDLLIKRLSDTDQARADAASTEAENTARAAFLAAELRRLPATVGLYREFDPDIRLQTLDDSLADLRGRLAAARVHYRETSRLVTDLRAQLAARTAERATLAADASPSVRRSGRSPAIDQLQLDLARATTERAAAAARRQALERSETGLTLRIATLNAAERGLGALQRDKDLRDEALRTASQVLAERSMVEAAETLRLANVRVIQPARVPQRPTDLKLLLALAGFVLGAGAAAGALVWRFAGRPAFFTAAGLAQASGLPVLAVFTQAEPTAV